MSKHLVLVGGGHAHMTVLLRLGDYTKRGHRVTLIAPSPYHYYSGMGPGMLAGTYRRQEIRFHVKRMVEDARGSFLEGTVTRVDPVNRILVLAPGDEFSYDVVSFNTGSSVPLDHIELKSSTNVFTVKPIVNLLKAQRLILDLIKDRKPSILVAGGGAAGLEISGNTWRLVHRHGAECHITLLAGGQFLKGLPEMARRLARGSLSARGIQVMEGTYLNRLEPNLAILKDARELPFDLVFLALGVRPSKLFQDSGLPTAQDEGLLVNGYLQSVAHPEIFGGGDCISLKDHPLDKVGVYAVRQNPILYHNLMAALEGGKMKTFEPQQTYLLIFNLGDGRGIFCRKNWAWDGRLAFTLKDYIDRRFMRKFQVSGERDEIGGKDDQL